MKIYDYLEGLSGRSKIMVCLLLSLLLSVADYLTGDISLVMFYFIPIAIASLFIGKKAGLVISTMCGLELFLTNFLTASEEVSILSTKSWNILMEVSFLLISGLLISNFKSESDQRKKQAVELRTANEDLDAFNYTVAHDLRKPLAVINGYCQLLQKVCSNKLDDKCNGYLKETYEGTLRMNRLIEALLNFSRMATVQPARETVDLCALAEEVAAAMKLVDPVRRVTFRITRGMSVKGDADLLRVVLENLIGNAWKYTSSRAEAVIEFGMVEMDGRPVYHVRDNGIGFDMAEVGKLFLPFRRLGGAEKYQGFGIGLATVQRIIQRHGGEIWAESVPEQGTTFHFTLSQFSKKPDTTQ